MDNQNHKNELAIRTTGLKKEYRLGQFNASTLKEDFLSWVAKKKGQEDPNSKIGSNHIVGKTLMALNGIDFEINRGETIGIIGPNGAGKSTLLKILCQITAPTAGVVELFGRITSMLEVGTGFSGEMTGRENIYQNGAILGMTKKEIDAVIEDIIDFSEVREFIDTPVKRYSSGMYVKLGFAIASHLDSEIVIMDEVMAVGDIDFQRKCIKQMKELAKDENRTVIYVSHNMNTIRELCNRVLVMDKGKIIFNGNTEEGIIAYYKIKDNEPKYHFDYTNVSTDRKDPSLLPCKILTIDLDKTNSLKYTSGESFCFKIKVLARQDFNELGLFLTITSAGNPIGTAPYISLGKLSSGEEKEYHVSIDTNNIVEGVYDVTTSLITKNSNRIFSYDIIVDAVQFVIERDNDFVWNSAVWGNHKINANRF